MADLFGTYDNRIKLTIDNTKIDATSQYPTAHSDTYVKSTTKFSTNYWEYYATDPTKLLTGGRLAQEWMSNNAITNQRFHIDLGSAKIINKIYYENSHDSGADTDRGVQNFIFQGSNTGAGTFDDLVYANDEGWTTLSTSQATFDQHTAADQADPKYITVTNITAYRYYAFKFADNYGDISMMALRHIALQTGIAWLPVTVFLTSTAGEEVFAEFDADADFDRVAFTKADGTTQLYADCELFDDSAQKAIYHVSRDGWIISGGIDTDFYMYYDNTAGNNTTYISASGAVAAQSVYDANFKAVYHMHDDTTSTILDSTSNNNDGTKKGANEPIEATGKVGQGQDYDGTHDYITVTDNASLDITGQITMEAIVKYASLADSAYCVPFGKWDTGGDARSYGLYVYGQAGNDVLIGSISEDGTWGATERSSTTYTGLTPTNWYYTVMTFNSTDDTVVLYLDGTAVSDGGEETAANDIHSSATDILIGAQHNSGTPYRFSDVIIDEVRLSNTQRTAAWLKATYNSLWDTLLTYGAEETSGAAEDNAIFFGACF